MVTIWDIYFASIVAMQTHPGAGSRGHHKLTLSECAKLADEMIKERTKRWPSEQQ